MASDVPEDAEPGTEAETEAEPELDARGQIAVPLGGADYVLRPSEEAVSTIERKLGCSLSDLAGKATYQRLTLDEMAIIVTEMMHAHAKSDPTAGPSYSGAKPERVRALIYEAGAPRILARLVPLLIGALTGGYSASGEAKAPGTTS